MEVKYWAFMKSDDNSIRHGKAKMTILTAEWDVVATVDHLLGPEEILTLFVDRGPADAQLATSATSTHDGELRLSTILLGQVSSLEDMVVVLRSKFVKLVLIDTPCTCKRKE